MAYDETLAVRVRSYFSATADLKEVKMFGGLAFLVRGNMGLAVVEEGLMVRVARDSYDETLSRPHARQMEMAGRPVRGFVLVGRDGIGQEGDLRAWIARGMDYAASLPPR